MYNLCNLIFERLVASGISDFFSNFSKVQSHKNLIVFNQDVTFLESVGNNLIL